MTGSHLTPHRGTLILVLGVLSLPFWITGPFAWYLGRQDIAEMDAGRMDPQGRDITQVGVIIGMIMTILAAIGVLFWIAFIALFASAAVVAHS